MSAEKNKNQKSLVSILAENKKGMLAKITSYFAENDMNIESLTLSAADTENRIHRTIAYITGDRNRINELCQGIEKLDGVMKVINLMADNYLERELGIIKIRTTNPAMPQITTIVSEYNGKTIHVGQSIMIFEVEEEEDKIDEFMNKVKKLTNEVEILRTGIVATSLDDNLVALDAEMPNM